MEQLTYSTLVPGEVAQYNHMCRVYADNNEYLITV